MLYLYERGKYDTAYRLLAWVWATYVDWFNGDGGMGDNGLSGLSGPECLLITCLCAFLFIILIWIGELWAVRLAQPEVTFAGI